MDQTQAPLLSLTDLHVTRGKPLLTSINWSVQPGQNWVILGRNGCGKSVLLQTLTGYFAPSQGSIELFGHQFGRYDWRALRQQVGIVASHLLQRLDFGESALDVIASGARAMLNATDWVEESERQKARDLMQKASLERLSNSLWGNLSQGEKQRVLILRALMNDPKLLILDEPCTGLDPIAREEFLHFMEMVGEQSRSSMARSVILVTHHLEEITPTFTHVLLLHDGRVQGAGAKEDLLTSQRLSEAFRHEVQISRSGERYELRMASEDLS